MKTRFLIAFLAGSLGGAALHALDWNQYRGLQSDNKTTETLASTDFLGKSKSLKWKAPTPLGFSSFAVVGSKAYTMVAEEDEDGLMREVCIALDLQTGKRAWSAWLTVMDYKSGGGNAGTSDNKGGDGPRSTPSVFGDKVWVYDSDMNLHCLSAKDGKSLWKVRVLKDHGGANIKWKNASAPLVVDDLVIVCGGGQGQSFLAFDRESGRIGLEERQRDRPPPPSPPSTGLDKSFSSKPPDWSPSTRSRERNCGGKSFPSKSRRRPPP